MHASPPEIPDPEAERRQQALAQLPAQCRAQLDTLMQSADARDSAGASAAYSALRSQCDAAMRNLADTVGRNLPERTMGTRSQRLLDRAMNGDVGAVPATAAAVAQGADSAGPGGGFDAAEVLDFGLTLFSAFAGMRGAMMPMRAPNVRVRAPSIAAPTQPQIVRPATTYGQGAPVYRPPPPMGQSDITGTSR